MKFEAKSELRRVRRLRGAVLVLVGVAALADVASAAVVRGLVRANAIPAKGALVTVTDSRRIATTVYAGTDGRFSVAVDGEPVSIRARLPGHADATLPYSAGTDVTLELAPAADVPGTLPSSAWLSLLPEGPEKRTFILVCASCHEVGATRVTKQGQIRNEARWRDAIAMMKALDAYKLIPDSFTADKYAPWLAQHLSPERIATLKPVAGSAPPADTKARIQEFPLPNETELPHDVLVDPSGQIWVTAFWGSEMWLLDPRTGKYEIYEVAASKSPSAQVRALEFDQKGMLWIVLGGTQSIVRLDPKTREYKTFPVGMYAHDIAIDSKGDVWINDYFSRPERIAHLATRTGKVKYYRLPSAGMPKADGMPLPYGLNIDAQDRLWSTQLAGNTLVRFDTRTKKAKLYRMPEGISGPRRNAIGLDGSIWIPEFNTGAITRFDPATEKFERFPLGDSALGPYDATTDPTDGSLWITGSLASSLVRFDPKMRSVEHYPLPTEPAYSRHVQIDPKSGDVWTAYSSLPTAVPRVVRFERVAPAASAAPGSTGQ